MIICIANFSVKQTTSKNDIEIDKIEIITQKVGTYRNIFIDLAPNHTQGNLFRLKITSIKNTFKYAIWYSIEIENLTHKSQTITLHLIIDSLMSFVGNELELNHVNILLNIFV